MSTNKQADEKEELNRRIEEQFWELFVQHGLRNSAHRKAILEVFFSTEDHLSVDEIEKRIRAKGCDATRETIIRTMNLLCDLGIAQRKVFENRPPVYEHLHLREHHDHLICTKCGHIIEFRQPQIETLQQQVARQYGFHSIRHKLEIYGLCEKCFGRRRRILPLAQTNAGETVTVLGIDGGRTLVKRVTELGLVTGREIEVISRTENGRMILRVGMGRIAVGDGIAGKILVTIADR